MSAEKLLQTLAKIEDPEEAREAMKCAVWIGQFLLFAQQNGAWMYRQQAHGGAPAPWTTDQLYELRNKFLLHLADSAAKDDAPAR